jgi:hypothetical protein
MLKKLISGITPYQQQFEMVITYQKNYKPEFQGNFKILQ